MELLILSGLAYVGYELSKDGKSERTEIKCQKILKNTNSYPIESDEPPVIPKPLHNNMVPFFASAKTQNSNENIKQRNLESFTGTDDAVYKSKKELEPLFKPHENKTNIYGTQLTLDDTNRKQRYVNNITSIMNNVSPLEKQYIGPGLNTGPDVASKGGFHDTFRILPDNVNAHKLNNFAGRIAGGKPLHYERQSTPFIVDNNKPQKYYTLKDVPITQSSAPVTASEVRGQFDIHCTQRGTPNLIQGILGPASMPDASQVPVQYTTRKYDNTDCSIHGNPGMPQHGAGAYTTTQTIISDGQREQCMDSQINVQNQSYGSGMYYFDGANPTQREDRNKYNGHLHNNGLLSATNNTGFIAHTTHRENSSVSYNGIAAQTGFKSIAGEYYANPTMRGKRTDFNGHAGSVHKASIRYDTARNANAYYQREELSKEYTPNAGNMNLRADATDVIPNMDVKNDCHELNHITPVKGHNKIIHKNAKGQVEFVPKIPVENTRLDLSIAQNQLKDNELSLTIN